jgi:DNA-binding Lrp family transcriptional regulator
MPSFQLDDIDVRILTVLQTDGRLTNLELEQSPGALNRM